jgi:hypothetical protein
MKLYVKGERRYTEASSHEIISAAGEQLTRLGMHAEASDLCAYARLLRAQGDKPVIDEAIRTVAKGED